MGNITYKIKEKFEALTEQLLIFSVTTPFICLLVYLFSKIFSKRGEISNYLFIYSTVIFSGLLYSLVLYIFVKEKTKISFYVSFIIFYIGFELIICFVTENNYAPYMLIPVSIIHFLFESILNEVFVMHDSFLSIWEGKTGQELETFLYHNNVEATELADAVKNFKSALYSIVALYIGISFLIKLSGNDFPVLLLLNTFVFTFSILLSFFKISYITKEAYFANMGYAKFIDQKQRLLKYVSIIFLLASICALIISRNNAFIKLNFNKLEDIEQNYVPQSVPASNNFTLQPDQEVDLDGVLGNSSDSTIMEIIFRIVSIAAVCLIVYVLLYFLLAPFFSSGWKSFWQDNKLYEYFKKILNDIRDFFHFFFNKTEDNYATVQAKSFKSQVTEFIKNSKKSKEKKAELDRLTKQFILLIDWGSKHNLIYKKNLAPAEYTELIRNYFKSNNLIENEEAALLCGNLFEKALYDKELLTTNEEEVYTNSIKKIISISDD